MMDTSDVLSPEEHWLTRAEAARYVGASGESTIRAAKAKGLQAACEPDGQAWHTPVALDAWTWRPDPAHRAVE